METLIADYADELSKYPKIELKVKTEPYPYVMIFVNKQFYKTKSKKRTLKKFLDNIKFNKLFLSKLLKF